MPTTPGLMDVDQALQRVVAAQRGGCLSLLLGPWLLRPGGWSALAGSFRRELRYTSHDGADDVARLAGLMLSREAMTMDRRAARASIGERATRILAETAEGDTSPRWASALEALTGTRCFTLWGDPVAESLVEACGLARPVHLAGRVDEPESCLLTDLDLGRVVHERPSEVDALRAVLAKGHVILAIGCSAPDLQHLRPLRDLLSTGDVIAALAGGRPGQWARVGHSTGATVVPLDGAWDTRLATWSWFLAAVAAGLAGRAAPPRPAAADREHPRVAEIGSRVAASVRQARTEGLSSPLHWLREWRPDHPLAAGPLPEPSGAHDVFVERRTHRGRPLSAVLRDRLLGGESVGITDALGMGGVGKTYLALRLAREFAGREAWRVAWVSLLDQGAEDALGTLAANFDLSFVDGIGIDEKSSAIGHLVAALLERGFRLLVVLDNAEKFPDLRMLLQSLGAASVLVTSRTTECDDRIDYHRLGHLDRPDARDLCRQIFDRHDDGLHRRLTPDDLTDLEFLCSGMLGGHPLAIRLVVSAHARLAAHGSPRPVSTLLGSIGGWLPQAVDRHLSVPGPVTGEYLRRNIKAAFEWVVGQLPAIARTVGGGEAGDHRGTVGLIPIVATIGHKPMTRGRIADVTKRLYDHVLKTVDDPFAGLESRVVVPLLSGLPMWVEDLGRLLEPSTLDRALQVLCAAALLEREGEPTARYRIHPLIREFAFERRREDRILGHDKARMVLGENGPTLDALYTAAIGGFADDRSLLDAYLDVFPRLRGRFGPTKLMCGKVLEEAYRLDIGALGDKVDMMCQAAELARHVGLTEEHSLLLAKAGELGYRLGRYVEGRRQMRDAIESLDPSNARQRPAWLWARCFLSPVAFGEPSLARSVADIVELLREVWAQPTINQPAIDIVGDLVAPLMLAGPDRQLRRAPLADTSPSNAVLDLARILSHWTSWRPYEADLARARELLDKAECSAAVSTLHRLAAETAFVCLEWRTGSIDHDEFEARLGRLQQAYLAAGDRGKAVLQEKARTEFEDALARSNWRAALTAAEVMSRLVDREMPERARLDSDVALFVAQALVALHDGYELNTAGAPSLAERARRWGAVALWGWIEIGLALHGWREPEEVAKCVVRARRWFIDFGGVVPPDASAVLARLRRLAESGGARIELLVDRLDAGDLTPPDMTPWLVKLDGSLPKRIMGKDGRSMRLVEPGLQPVFGRERWIMPIYIDDAPVDQAAFAAFARATGRTPVCLDAGDGQWVMGVSAEEAAAYARWAGKRLPLAVDWYCAQWQIAAGGRPTRSPSWAHAIDTTLDGISVILDGATPVSSRGLLAASRADARAPDPQAEGGRVDDGSERMAGEIAVYFRGEWLREEPFASYLDSRFIKPYRAAVPRSEWEEASRLATEAIACLAQSIRQRCALLERLPTLDRGARQALLAHLIELKSARLAAAESDTAAAAELLREIRASKAGWRARIAASGREEASPPARRKATAKFVRAIDAHFSGAWLQNTSTALDAFEERVVDRVPPGPAGSAEDYAVTLALGIAASVAFDLPWKVRLLDVLPRLDTIRLRALGELFDTERRDAVKLSDGGQRSRLLERARTARAAFLGWLCDDDPRPRPAANSRIAVSKDRDGDGAAAADDDKAALGELLNGGWLSAVPGVRDAAYATIREAWSRLGPEIAPPDVQLTRCFVCTPRWTLRQKLAFLQHVERYPAAQLARLGSILAHDRSIDGQVPDSWLAFIRRGRGGWSEHAARLSAGPAGPTPPGEAPELPEAVRLSAAVAAHFDGRWLIESAALQELYLEPLLSALALAFPSRGRDGCRQFAIDVAVSLSLSADRKHAVLIAIPELGRGQMDRLQEIFAEERARLTALPPVQLAGLLEACNVSARQFVELVCPDAVVFRTEAASHQHPVVWSGQHPRGQFILQGDPMTDPVWRRLAPSAGRAVGIRCVRLAVTVRDGSTTPAD